MSIGRFSAFIFVAAVGFLATAQAQSVESRARAPDPGDAKAAVPPVRYESAFTRYRRNAEVEVGPWREQNDAVGRIGGWRVYGREAIPDPKEVDRPAGGGDRSDKDGKPVRSDRPGAPR
jgi:hypothetical protein